MLMCVFFFFVLWSFVLISGANPTKSINTSFYYNYEDLTNFLHNVTAQYPNLTKLHSIGKSVQNRVLWALEITSNVSLADPRKPKFKYIGNMHGNEVVGRQVLVYLIQYLLGNYPQDKRVLNLVDTVDIFIMPTMNPDGFEMSKIGDCHGDDGRYNANFEDLNRNFPDQFYPDAGKNIQPETQAVIDWIEHTNFVLSANFHGGNLVAVYPWCDSLKHEDGIYSASPDDAVYKHLAQTYANKHKTMSVSHCDIVFPGGVTNGAAWYDVIGGMEDYNYVHGNCLEIALELSCCKYPESSQLATEWQNNKDALLTFIEQVHIGVHGQVLDASGKGVPGAVITVEGNQKSITANAHGYYWRLLVPGTYTVTASAAGYHSVDAHKEVTVSEGEGTTLLLYLAKGLATDTGPESSISPLLFITIGLGVLALLLVSTLIYWYCKRSRESIPYSRVGFRPVNPSDGRIEGELFGDIASQRSIIGDVNEYHDNSSEEEQFVNTYEKT